MEVITLDYYQEHHEELEEFVDNHVGHNVLSLISDRGGQVSIDLLEEFENIHDKETGQLQEVFEYWTVSRMMYEWLIELGEPVADMGSCYVWGRTTTGQNIALDYVISRIHSEIHGNTEEVTV